MPYAYSHFPGEGKLLIKNLGGNHRPDSRRGRLDNFSVPAWWLIKLSAIWRNGENERCNLGIGSKSDWTQWGLLLSKDKDT